MIPLIVVVVLLVVAGLWLVGRYNALVRLRNQAEQAWAGIDVQLTRRHDLIPNLVETVKGYAGHERSTLENVISARNAAVAAPGPAAKGQAEGILTAALRQLFALQEAYPDLKADVNFQQLQAELANTEQLLAGARSTYNAAVRLYDDGREQFPGNIVAALFSFAEREYYEVDDPAARGPVEVSFE
jgi:LemA protein